MALIKVQSVILYYNKFLRYFLHCVLKYAYLKIILSPVLTTALFTDTKKMLFYLVFYRISII
jgi:hypothetical protein